MNIIKRILATTTGALATVAAFCLMLIGAAAVASDQLADSGWHPPTTPARTLPAGQALEQVHYFAVIRSNPGGWQILDDAGHDPQGFTGVNCAASGKLALTFPTVARVGVFTITADETWVAKYHPGASVGFSQAAITIKTRDGAAVSCSSSGLGSPSGNFWVDMWAWAPVEETPTPTPSAT